PTRLRTTRFPYTTLFRSRHASSSKHLPRVERASDAKHAQEAAEKRPRRHRGTPNGAMGEAVGSVPNGDAVASQRLPARAWRRLQDRKSTRLNSSHQIIPY